MEMFYLVLSIISSNSVVIPEKYNKEQCEIAGKTARLMYACIPAPKSNDEFNCMTAIADPMKGMGYGMLAKIRCSEYVKPN